MVRLRMVPVFAIVLNVLLAQLSSQTGNDNTFALFRQKRYHFSTSLKLNWFKAMEYCRTRGMHLLSVRNAQEREAFIEYLSERTDYVRTRHVMIWLSANDLGEEGEFYWSATGEQVTYSNWSPGEPNNAEFDDCTNEDCLVLEYWAFRGDGYNYTFDDRTCKYEYHFVCETLSR